MVLLYKIKGVISMNNQIYGSFFGNLSLPFIQHVYRPLPDTYKPCRQILMTTINSSASGSSFLPASSLPLFPKYEVDYVVISSWERNSYSIEDDAFASLFPCVYSNGEFMLYQVTDEKQKKQP